MKNSFYLRKFFLAFLLIGLTTSCARINFWMGNERYNHLEYVDAIRLYEKALAKKDYPQAMLRLADAYDQNNRYKKAQYWYSRAMAFPDCKETHRKRLAELMISNEDYSGAKKFIQAHLDSDPDDHEWNKLALSCDSVQQFKQDSMFWTVEKLPSKINRDGSNFSPMMTGQGLVFASERGPEKGRKEAEWTGKPYLDLFYTQQAEDGSWSDPQPFEGKINGPWNEGPMVIDEARGIMYFTRNNYLKKSREKSSDWENNLQIFTARNVDGEWQDIQPMAFNSKEFSCGHPALSPDGNTLYFVSDMPGGAGGADIYKVVRDELTVGQTWSEPENLGTVINTPGEEMFPFVAPDGNLYYSSDGFPGLGGLDVFVAEAKGKSWKPPVNMHFPLNSTHDDFGFFIDPETNKGFLSSNRDSEEGVDEIYMFNRNYPSYFLRGLVINKKDEAPLRDAEVVMVNGENGNQLIFKTDGEGRFFTPLDAQTDYELGAEKQGFFRNSVTLTTKGDRWSKEYEVVIPLDRFIIGKPIVLEDIYYDFDESYIREDAKPSLDNLLKILQDNPNITIELSSHTDARGSRRYNQKLSQARAESAVNYLIEGGIDAERILAKGYGESQPVNECRDGVKCEEEMHQMNRRTEFKVLKK